MKKNNSKNEFKIYDLYDIKKSKTGIKDYIFHNKSTKQFLIFLIFTLIVMLLGYYYDAIVLSLLQIIFIIIYIVSINFSKRHYDINLMTNKDMPIENEVIINDEEIIDRNTNTGVTRKFSFNRVTNIIENKESIILCLRKYYIININKNNIVGGTKEELIEHLFSKCPNIKKKKVISAKKNRWIIPTYILGLLVTIVLSFILNYNSDIFYYDTRSVLVFNDYEITTNDMKYGLDNNSTFKAIQKDYNHEIYIYKYKNLEEAKNVFDSMVSIPKKLTDDIEYDKNNYERYIINSKFYYYVLILKDKYVMCAKSTNRHKSELNEIIDTMKWLK